MLSDTESGLTLSGLTLSGLCLSHEEKRGRESRPMTEKNFNKKKADEVDKTRT